MGVRVLSEQVFPRWNEYADGGKMLTWTADNLIVDPRYMNGDLEINGESHRSAHAIKNAEKKKRYFEAHGLWFEELENAEVSRESIAAILAKHVRRVDDYGGAY